MEKINYNGHTIVIKQDSPSDDNPRDWDNVGTMVVFHRNRSIGDKHNFDDKEELAYFLGLIKPGPAPRRPNYKALTGDPFTSFEIAEFRRKSHVSDWTSYRYKRGDLSLYGQAEAAATEGVRLNLRQWYTMVSYNIKREQWLDIVERRQYLDYAPFDGVCLPIYLRGNDDSLFAGSAEAEYNDGVAGYIYADRATILKEYGDGKTRLTKAMRQRAIDRLKGEVETYEQWASGDVWGYIIYKGNDEIDDDFCIDCADELDSLWGIYGEDEAIRQAKEYIDNLKSE